MTKGIRERWIVALGVFAVVAGMLAFSVLMPSKTIGLETDVPTIEDPNSQDPTDGNAGDTDANAADPPASLPEAGTGFEGDTSVRPVLLMGMLAALGVTLGGAGLVAARQTRRADDR
jgi:hypothetical protein